MPVTSIIQSGAVSAWQQILDEATATGATAVYDPTNPDTRTLRTSGPDSFFSAIADGLGNLPDLVQATDSKQFKLLEGEFGDLDGAEADAANSRLMAWGSANPLSQPTLYIAVGQQTNNSTNKMVFSSNEPAGQQRWRAFVLNWRLDAGADLDGGTSDTAKHVWTSRWDGTSSYMRQDSAAFFGPGDAGSKALDTLYWGAYYGGSNYWTGPLGVLIIYDTPPSDADRDSMEDLLHTLTGIAKA